ncbi:efflux RND transporter permease subunit, partial [bacterium]|nr:efflux RND transporter permease subunit [bacterium]
YLGSAYVNDFNLDGRTYQVRIQADAKFRATKQDILDLQVRSLDGNAVPMGTLINITEEFGPSVIRRYQMYPSASINGSAGADISSGEALDLMEQLANQTLPDQFGFEWTGLSYQEKAAGGQAVILALAIMAVFLVLAAQYESWTMPAAVIAVVPLSALGVVAILTARGADANVYTQIGIVLLVALASKNAILIVEFASEKRKEGMSITESAVEAARLRFRAILMTAFSSILGFLPLLIASGAGAASRQAVGNAVVGGMIAATAFSLLFVPSFFVIFRRLGELGQNPENDPAFAGNSEPMPPATAEALASDTAQPAATPISDATEEVTDESKASSEASTDTETTETNTPPSDENDSAAQ